MSQPVTAIRPSRSLAPLSVIDDQLHDALNFGLSENLATALSAIFIALSMLLLGDIVSRVVVRGRAHAVSSFAVHRSYLLSRVINPLALCAALARQLRGSATADDVDDDDADELNRPPAPAFPTRASVPIFALGFALLAADLLFIFLSTSTTAPAAVDTRALRALALHDSHGADESVEFTSLLASRYYIEPITTRPRFIPRARALLEAQVTMSNSTWSARRRAAVRVAVQDNWVVFEVTTASFNRSLRIRQSVKTPNITLYYVVPDITRDNARKTVLQQLQNTGLDSQHTGSPKPSAGLFGDSWSEEFSVDIGNRSAPPSFVAAARAELQGSRGDVEDEARMFAWNLYLGNATTVPLALTGRARAQSILNPLSHLDDADEPLVLYQAPRLSLGGCAIVAAALLAIWLVLAFILGLRPAVEHRVAWVWVFNRSFEPKDLERFEDRIRGLTKDDNDFTKFKVDSPHISQNSS